MEIICFIGQSSSGIQEEGTVLLKELPVSARQNCHGREAIQDIFQHNYLSGNSNNLPWYFRAVKLKCVFLHFSQQILKTLRQEPEVQCRSVEVREWYSCAALHPILEVPINISMCVHFVGWYFSCRLFSLLTPSEGTVSFIEIPIVLLCTVRDVVNASHN